MQWIQKHFQRYRTRSPWDFCWRITIEGIIVSLIAAVITDILGSPERKIDLDIWFFLVMSIAAAPLYETVLLQALPVWIARLCKARFSIQIVSSMVPFTIIHAAEGIQAGVAAGLVSGFYLAFTYVHWREKSLWTALWVTAVSHAIHNAIVVSVALIFGVI